MQKDKATSNLEYEYETLQQSTLNTLKEIKNLSLFCNEIHSQGEKFYEGTKKALDSFFNNDYLFDVTSKMSQIIIFFYQTTSMFLTNIKGLLDNYTKDIIEPLDEYKNKIGTNYKTILNDMNNIFDDYKATKDKVKKVKDIYYQSCKNLYNLDDKKKKLDNIYDLQSRAESNKQVYMYEIDYSNKNLELFDNDYAKLQDTIKATEENRLLMMQYILTHYDRTLKEFNGLTSDMQAQFSEKLSTWELEQDIKYFTEEFNFMNQNNERFLKESFEDYDHENDTTEEEKPESNSLLSKGKKLITFIGEYDNIDKYQSEEFQTEVATNYLKYLVTEKEIPINLISISNKLVLDFSDFCTVFIRKYFENYKQNYLEIKNFANLRHFSNLLTGILLCKDDTSGNRMNLIYYSTIIGQKCYSHNESKNKKHFSKIYLSGIMNKCKQFKSVDFWNELFEYRYKQKLVKIMNYINDKYEKEQKEINERKKNSKNEGNDTSSDNTKGSNSDTTGSVAGINANLKFNVFSTLGSGITNLFKGDSQNDKKNKKKKKKKYENAYAAIAEFDNFEKLPLDYQNEFKKHAVKQLDLIIKEFIPLFINYKYGMSNGIDYLVGLCNKFQIDSQLMNYYVISFNTQNYSVKQFDEKDYQNQLLRDCINNIRERRDDAILSRYPIYEGVKKMKDSEKEIIIGNMVKYLDLEDKKKILYLSKRLQTKMKKKVYSSILEGNSKGEISMKLRLSIWHSILKTAEIKKDIQYKSQLEKTRLTKYDAYSNCPFAIIDLDVQRTQFDENLQENRKKINAILKTCAILCPRVNYCQGMNFIAAFLLKITKDEEETFYLLLGLLMNTKYSKIFYDDLQKLRRYFLAFEKLLALFNPLVSNFLKSNNIMANYYTSAWFITLFTSSMMKNKKLDCFIRLWDYFLLSGWKCIFNAALVLLDINDERVISLRNEALMSFLSGDAAHEFLYEKSDIFLDAMKSMRVKNKLLHNIKKEVKNEEILMKEVDAEDK